MFLFIFHRVLLEEKISLRLNQSLENSNITTTMEYTTDSSLENMSSISYQYYSTNDFISTESSYINSTPMNKNLSNVTESLESLLYQRTFYQNWYCLLIIAACVLSFVGNLIFFIFSLKVSKNLHKEMISKVLGSRISFFDVNMSGNILTKFSKDLFNVDEWIPYIINEAMRVSKYNKFYA